MSRRSVQFRIAFPDIEEIEILGRSLSEEEKAFRRRLKRSR